MEPGLQRRKRVLPLDPQGTPVGLALDGAAAVFLLRKAANPARIPKQLLAFSP